MKNIYAASSNPGKLREFALVVRELGLSDIALLPLPGLEDIAPPEEAGRTFEENASQKALYYSQFAAEPVLADDSGIEVDALNRAPGIHSARYAGVNANPESNNRLLLENMQAETNRTARFVCAVALARQGALLNTVQAAVEGELLHAPQGANGFGYDPLFFYPPFNCSFGQLDDSRKFNVSHRGQALRQIFHWLAQASI